MPLRELSWISLTATVNSIKSPNQFLRRLLFGRHVTLPTETIEIGYVTGGREVAPFVRKNGEAIMVSGRGRTTKTVQGPNIRIKRPFTPSELLFGRPVGTVQYVQSAGQVISAAQAHIAEDLQIMADMITNAEEYLCAFALRGQISYAVEDEEVFTISMPKPSANDITLSTFWDDADPTAVRIFANVLAAKRAISDDTGLAGPTDAILGGDASAQLMELAEAGQIKLLNNLDRNLTGGGLDFTQNFRDDGAIYLGTFAGVRWWEYSRQVTVNGVATDLIRPKYAEFVTATAAADNVMYYAAIPDMDALQGRSFQGERFSKSWLIKDPSSQMSLVHSRPLPVMRKPGSTVSMKVIS